MGAQEEKTCIRYHQTLNGMDFTFDLTHFFASIGVLNSVWGDEAPQAQRDTDSNIIITLLQQRAEGNESEWMVISQGWNLSRGKVRL